MMRRPVLQNKPQLKLPFSHGPSALMVCAAPHGIKNHASSSTKVASMNSTSAAAAEAASPVRINNFSQPDSGPVEVNNRKIKTLDDQFLQDALETQFPREFDGGIGIKPKRPVARDATESNYSDVEAIILAGGGCEGKKNPLELKQALPACPIAGRYKIVDIPISNCVNSGVTKINILTQWNSTSLNSHISRAYNNNSDIREKGFVDVVAANQTFDDKEWASGPADAVRRQLAERADPTKEVASDLLVMGGDAIYRMDFSTIIEAHRESGADVTIAAMQVKRKDASKYGIMGVERNQQVSGFMEKPKGADLDQFTFRSNHASRSHPYTASMGIYVFSRDALLDLLNPSDGNTPAMQSFGAEVLPMALKRGKKVVCANFGAHFFWHNLSTFRDYFTTSIQIARRNSVFPLSDPDWPTFTECAQSMPPARYSGDCSVSGSIVGDGCRVESAVIRNSVVGSGAIVGKNAFLDRVVVLGADNVPNVDQENRGKIGENAILQNCVVDRNAYIGENCRIVNAKNVKDGEGEGYVIRDGIVCVQADIPAGTVI